MVMDSGLGELSEIMSHSGIKFDEYYSNHGLGTLSVSHNHLDLSFLSPDSSSAQTSTPSSGVSHEGEMVDEMFSDMALKYINQMLMDEDMDEQLSIYQETSALHEAEKSLYEVIGEKYPPSTDGPAFYEDHNAESPVDNGNSQNSNNCCGSSSSSSSSSGGSSSNLDSSWVSDAVEQQHSQYVVDFVSTDYSAQPLLRSAAGVSSGAVKLDDEFPMEFLTVPDVFSESQLASQFRRGVEEASKFLPDSKPLVIDLESNGSSLAKKKANKEESKVKLEKNDESDYLVSRLRGRKHPHQEDLETQEGRVNKQSAIYDNSIQEASIFDMVLLCKKSFAGPASSTIEEWSKQISPPNGGVKDSKNGQTKGSNGSKGRGKKQGKRDVVDLRTLLITCAQSVATDDRRSAGELLKQIRQHSTPFGDGTERLAHYFANALEARLAGTGSQIYSGLAMKRTAADILKAYHLYISSCPFKKISHFFSNQTIMNAVEGKSRLHIVDFGIYYGFQWPCLLHRLSKRPGGPPKLRITGIELPQPGFRPQDRIEDTGRRLADYCRRFGIHFDYHPIACKWEDVQPEDIAIHEDEVLIVNCLYRLKSLLDETVMVDSPRNILLNNIRMMNPDVFIHGIVNGAYNAPFFITRFKEVLFHYSALFDMLETTILREHPERVLLEREIYGREALNVIACEGLERIERPETYKQWQVRNMRAGFEQIPLDADIMKKARNRVKDCYHKDYVIDEDSQWMLQGWKGRIIHALSTWRPAH